MDELFNFDLPFVANLNVKLHNIYFKLKINLLSGLAPFGLKRDWIYFLRLSLTALPMTLMIIFSATTILTNFEIQTFSEIVICYTAALVNVNALFKYLIN